MEQIKREKILKFVKEFVEKGKLLQLATLENDQPWVVSCWYTVDDDFTFYWISGQEARHTLELKRHNKVACTVTPHYSLEKLGQKVQSLSFEGVAEEVSGIKLENIYKNFVARWTLATRHINLDRIKKGLSGSRLYKVKATKLVWYDEINFPDDSRQEIVL